MNADFYTKAVLTVIAGSLVAIVFQHSTSNAVARDEVMRVVICDADDFRRCARVIEVKETNALAVIPD